MKKFITFSIALALASPLFAETLRVFKCSEDGIPGQTDPQLMGFSISADAHFICGSIEQGSGIFIADCVSGEVKWKLEGEAGSELRAVANSGMGIGFVDDNGALFSFDSNEVSLIKAPEGVRYIQGEGISSDASVLVGSFTQQSFSTEAACSIDGGAWNPLPIPSDEEKGNLAMYMNGMSAAKAVSADGKVIMGHLGSFTFPIVWTRNEAGEYIPDFYPVRYIKAVEADRNDDSKPLYGLSGMYTCMSSNGKYVATVGLIADEDNTATRIVPVIYDTVEKTLIIYSEIQEIDEVGVGLYPRAIANDGTFIGTVSSPADPAGNFGAFIMRAGQQQAELFIDAFPEYADLLGEADVLGQNIPTGISADGNNILGYTYYSEDYDISSAAPAYYLTYLITLDDNAVETLEGASKAIPEAIYSIDGRPLSRLQKGLNIIRHSDGSVSKLLK